MPGFGCTAGLENILWTCLLLPPVLQVNPNRGLNGNYSHNANPNPNPPSLRQLLASVQGLANEPVEGRKACVSWYILEDETEPRSS